MGLQDGYGKHIHQTVSKIPHHMTTSFVHGVIERSVWVTIHFSQNMTSPYLIPYQLLHFWMGMDKNFNNSIRNYNKFNDVCYGVTWHSFYLEIFNQATTRKRLLVQGGTTYETIDFESNQNLLYLTNTNRCHKPTMTWPNEYFPPGHKLQDTDMQSGSYQCTTEELAPGHSKHFHFTPEQLPDYQCWDIINVDNVGQDYMRMFPARQHTDLQSFDLPITTADKNNYQSTTISLETHSLPAIFIDQPHISSESGYMKFIYRTRWDFKMSYTLHTQQTARDEYSSSRRIVPYPRAKTWSTTENVHYVQFNCVPSYH
jgi:hypothetical protein